MYFPSTYLIPSIAKQSENIIGELLLNDFSLWAFGENYQVKNTQNLLNSWHKLHGDKLMINSDEEISIGLRKMITLWIKEKLK